MVRTGCTPCCVSNDEGQIMENCRRLWTRMLTLVFGLSLGVQPGQAEDVFARLTTDVLRTGIAEQTPRSALTQDEAARLQPISAANSSPCLVVRTTEQGLSKLLVSWGFRRSGQELKPVLLIEQLVTYRSVNEDITRAVRQEVMLFPDFGYDLDIGQVVPLDEGADLVFRGSAAIEACPGSELYTLDGAPPAATTASDMPDPNDHEGVLPRDFQGDWQLDVDGRWQGTLQLTVQDNGEIGGDFVSQESRSVYPARGRVVGGSHRARLSIGFENSELTMDAWLWTSDKSEFAGTAQLAGRPFGLHAQRIAADRN